MGDGGSGSAALATRQAGAGAPEPRGRSRLLVVDDNAINIQLLVASLKGEHDVLTATGGEQALAACLRQRPDLVLLDVMMPGLDGFEVCRRLQADDATRDIPVILITAYGDEQAEMDGLGAGAVDFISKPISPRIVRARVTTHLTLKRQADQLRGLAYIDGLTGACNRRYFDDYLQRECGRAHRAGTALSIALVDVDHFKDYNDHYGHPAGDECLRQVVRLVQSGLHRPGDVCARYGGEEFALVLPDTDARGARHVADALLQRLVQARIAHAASRVGPILTASVGWCTLAAGTAGSPAALLSGADAQLYLAKSRGRNQACGALLPTC